MKKILLVVLLSVFTVCIFTGSVAAENLVSNPGFEDGDTEDWYGFGEEAEIEAVSEDSASGSYCAYVTDRAEDWQGIGQYMTDVMEPGTYYDISASIKIAEHEEGEHFPKISIKRVIIEDGEEEEIYEGAVQGELEPGEWQELSGRYQLQGEEIEEVELYIEGPDPDVDFYVDDVAVEEVDGGGENWEEEADERIEEIRKGDAVVRVVDDSGNPVENVEVTVEQDRREFGFGTAFSRQGLDHQQYRDFLSENYEWTVFENEAKWYWNESSQGNVAYDDADYMYEFCEENDLKVRGHAIFWEVDEYVPNWVQNLEGEELQDAVDSRLESVVNHFQGKFEHWDVNNEILHGDFFESRLGEDIHTYMFNETRELDPDVELFMNDYNVITYNEDAQYKSLIQDLLDQGAEINGIGVQGHFNDVVDPLVVESRLDNLAELDLPIWITEYDSETSDVQQRADNLEDLYRIGFSHPAVEGILMWGFWEGDHWRGADAAIVDQDFTVNEAGHRYQDLMEEWSTDDSGYTDSSGEFEFRGYHGDYDITIDVPGEDLIEDSVSVSSETEMDEFEYSTDGSSVGPESGDVNDDGDINSMDFSLLRGYILGESVEIDEKAADINEDDEINSFDLSRLQNIILEN